MSYENNLTFFPVIIFLAAHFDGSKKLVFSYDASANQILRNLVANTNAQTANAGDLVSDFTAELPEDFHP